MVVFEEPVVVEWEVVADEVVPVVVADVEPEVEPEVVVVPVVVLPVTELLDAEPVPVRENILL